jgi:cell division transport system permease protein
MTARNEAAKMARVERERDRLMPQNPIMPKVHAPIGTLIIAMTVMCYLATLSIGGMALINRAVDRWTSDISGEVTVQIRPLAGKDVNVQTQLAAQLLEQTPGISNVRILSEEDAAALLEPWLGKHKILEELPIPRLVSAEVDKATPPDLAALAEKVAREVEGASLDTHRQWQDELTATARTLRWLGLGVVGLIIAASIGIVVFATRSALETNREVLEVLYLVGARDRFIASQVEQRFFRAGLKAGLTGVLGALVTFGLVYLAGYAGSAPGMFATLDDLLSVPLSRSYGDYIWFVLVPIVATLICLVTARIATRRILASVF